jgi:DNA invertase Pin-like site-specific DNA recombinase
MRVVVYARYSSENQRAASIDDQVEVCRRFAEARGWTIQTLYKDAALSGSSRFRPGYQSLLADLDRRKFDVVLVEALDRLGRKLADVADLHDRCDFADVKLITTNVGEITPMHIGMLGTMAQVFISDLREKTWRGFLNVSPAATVLARSPSSLTKSASPALAAGRGAIPQSADNSIAERASSTMPFMWAGSNGIAAATSRTRAPGSA